MIRKRRKINDIVNRHLGCGGCSGKAEEEGIYEGKKVKLNVPFRIPGKEINYGIYRKDPTGKVIFKKWH